MEQQARARVEQVVSSVSPPPSTNQSENESSAPTKQKDWNESYFKQKDMARRYKNAEVITGPFAKTLIQQAGLLDANDVSQLTILDNACGTGVVAAAIHDLLDSSTKKRMKLTCGDFSEPMLQAVKERIEENGWNNTEARMVDAQRTGLPDASFSHVLANFVIMGLQEPDAAIAECFRILRPGGTCAFTTWNHVAWIDDLRAAFATLPGPPAFPDDLTMYRSWGKGDWFSSEWIQSHLQQTSQFSDLHVETVSKDLEMESPAAMVDTLSVMIPMILKRFWSERDQKEKGEMAVPALSKYMNEKYGEGNKVGMHWVANVVTMKKPIE